MAAEAFSYCRMARLLMLAFRSAVSPDSSAASRSESVGVEAQWCGGGPSSVECKPRRAGFADFAAEMQIEKILKSTSVTRTTPHRSNYEHLWVDHR